MKKTAIFVLTFIILGVSFNHKVQGLNVDKYRTINNILDLAIFELDHDSNTYHTYESIYVDEGEEYTFIIDKKFIGSKLLTHLTIVENGQERQLEMENLSSFYRNTFIPSTYEFNIIDFEFEGIENTNIMLYKGDEMMFENVYSPYNALDNIQSGTLVVDYDKPLTVNRINSFIDAEYPGRREQLGAFTVRNTYVHKLGTYEAVYISTINNIINTFVLNIEVVDTTAPIIETKALTYSFVNRPTIEEIVKDIIIYDNVDIIKPSDVSVISDNYTGLTEVGTYNVEISVKDKSNNVTNAIIPIEVADRNAPVITGPSAIFTYTTRNILTDDDILQTMKYSDDVDLESNIVRSILLESNEYKGNERKPGKYSVVIQAVDSEGNITNKTVVIHVIANEQASFIINERITTNVSNLISEQEIRKVFIASANRAGVNLSSVKINKDIYDLNHNKKGTYSAYIEYEANNKVGYSEIFIDVNGKDFESKYLLLGIPLILVISVPIVILRRKKY